MLQKCAAVKRLDLGALGALIWVSRRCKTVRRWQTRCWHLRPLKL